MKRSIYFLIVLLIGFTSFAQIGINATTIDPSAALDIQYGSSPKGLLTPRMTTAQRLSISTSPRVAADGLIVYDTDMKSLFHYSTGSASWIRMSSDATGRTNFKRIKTEADLIASSTVVASNYQLNTNTYYEINGTITLTKSIDLNNAYVAGMDAYEDVLSFPGGTVFKGYTGGSIKNVTLKGGKAFEITGPGIAIGSLLVQNTIIDGMTESVGSISGFGLYYSAIIQFVNNTNGITYSNIGHLLLDNQAWLNTNNGTFEKLTGSFGLVQKNSGFSTVNGADVALDVSDASLAVGTGVISGTVFSGTTSSLTGYVKENAATSYIGYNFSNAWTVDAPGIPRESDNFATANLYFDGSSVVTITNNTAFKLPVNTASIRLFRTAEGLVTNSENRLVYKGLDRRAINVYGSISFTATAGSVFTFSIYKNGVKVPGSDVTATVLQTNARQAVPILGTVDVSKDEYIEVYVQKVSAGDEQFLTTSYNVIVD